MRQEMNKQNAFVAVILGVGAMVLSGCGVEVLTTTAVRGEIETKQAQSALRQLDQVRGQVNTLQVEQAVKAYRGDHGINPPSLEALVPNYLPQTPVKADGAPYYYDPKTGKVSERPLVPGY